MRESFAKIKDTAIYNVLMYLDTRHSRYQDDAKSALKEFALCYGFAIKKQDDRKIKLTKLQSDRLKKHNSLKKKKKKKKEKPSDMIYSKLKEFLLNERGYQATVPPLYEAL